MLCPFRGGHAVSASHWSHLQTIAQYNTRQDGYIGGMCSCASYVLQAGNWRTLCKCLHILLVMTSLNSCMMDMVTMHMARPCPTPHLWQGTTSIEIHTAGGRTQHFSRVSSSGTQIQPIKHYYCHTLAAVWITQVSLFNHILLHWQSCVMLCRAGFRVNVPSTVVLSFKIYLMSIFN